MEGGPAMAMAGSNDIITHAAMIGNNFRGKHPTDAACENISVPAAKILPWPS